MATRREIRAQIGRDTVRGLLIVNGGGAVALLALLPALLDRAGVETVGKATLWAVLIFMIGLALAVVHSHCSRQCDLAHEQKAPAGELFGMRLREPGVCFASRVCMWGSLACFVSGGLIVAGTGLLTLDFKPQPPAAVSSLNAL